MKFVIINKMDEETNRKENPVSLQALGELIGRVYLAGQLGTDTYGGNRDVYNALGYKKELRYIDYWSRYKRQDIAKAVIDRPVKASWKGEIEVIETIEEKETAFEKSWLQIYNDLKLKSIFIRADKLTGIGRYSVLLLGLSDVTKEDDFIKPVTKKNGLKLLYVKPISEINADIGEFVTDPTDVRFGLPKTYNLKTSDGRNTKSISVHYSRIVHLVEDLGENEVFGTPRLESLYNRLVDLEKLIGGDAEMFWRGARPGYTGEVDPDYQMSEKARADLQEQIAEFENNLRRVLVNQGVKYNALAQQIADPINHVDVQIQMISAVTGIPKRILTGSERGELSSAQDKLEWIAYVTSRREEQNEPMILRPFIDKCIEIGVLPKPAKPYTIVWDKLFSLSDKEKVEMGKIRAEALKEYTTNGITQEIIPVDTFAEYFLAFDKTQIAEIMSKIDLERIRETALSLVEKEIMKEGKPAAGVPPVTEKD
jgi:hypothetical protein